MRFGSIRGGFWLAEEAALGEHARKGSRSAEKITQFRCAFEANTLLDRESTIIAQLLVKAEMVYCKNRLECKTLNFLVQE